MDNVQLLRKRTSLTFWWQPGKWAASVVWGVVRNAPEECSTSLPCCSGVKRSFAPGLFRHVSPYTATPCMEKTGERVENKEHPTIGDTTLQVKLNGSPDGCDQWRRSPKKTRAMDSCYIYWSYLTTPVSISVSKYEEIHSAKTIHIVVLKKAENNSCLFVLVNKSN